MKGWLPILLRYFLKLFFYNQLDLRLYLYHYIHLYIHMLSWVAEKARRLGTSQSSEYSHGSVSGTRMSALFGVVVLNNKSLLWPTIFFLLGILSFERKITDIRSMKFPICWYKMMKLWVSQLSSPLFVTLISCPLTTLSREWIKPSQVNSWEKKQLEWNKNHGDLVGERVMSV